MRPLFMLAALLLAQLRICGTDNTPPPPLAAPPPVAGTGTVSIDNGPPTIPRHGGSVVVAGPRAVEVVPHADGNVEAYVADAQGNVPPPAGVTLSVQLHAVDGAVHPVELAWDPTDLRYEGRLAGVTPAPGPVTVQLVTNEMPVVAIAPSVVVLPSVMVAHPPPVVVAQPAVRGGVVVEPPVAGVVVEGPSAGVVVQPPVAGVVVNMPPVAGVVVEGPSAGVVVEGPSAGVVVRPPAGAVVVRQPRAVFVAPPPPALEVGLGVEVGGGVIVEGGGRGHGHGEHVPNGNAYGWHRNHGH